MNKNKDSLIVIAKINLNANSQFILLNSNNKDDITSHLVGF